MVGNDVLQWFADAAARFPARAAVEHGSRRLTYGDLKRWSDELARALGAGGVTAADSAPPVVAVGVADPLARVAALLGVLGAGCAYAPVDLTAPEARLDRLLGALEPAWLLGDADSAAVLPVGWRGGGRWLHLDAGRLAVTGETGEVSGASGSPGVRSPTPDALATLFATSGSTGEPKLIAGRYRGIGHFIRWEAALLGLGAGVRVSQLTSPHFDAYLRDVFLPLCLGGTLAIPEKPEVRLDAGSLVEWIDAERIEVVHCVPSLFHLVCAGDLHSRACESLRAVLLSGEPPLHADLARWFGVFGERVRMVNLYGPTETTMTKLFHDVSPADLRRRAIPIGRPMEGAAALLVDGAGRPAAPGTVGEIFLRTPYRSLGYLGRPDLTAERFVPSPWGADPGDLVYRTGDLGRLLPDGSLDLVGRRDLQVKIRGQRIELGEVENGLLAHPGVLAAAALARPDAEGLLTLWAFVALREGTAPRELRERLAERLPAHLVPDRLVPLAELPRTATGKLDRRALAALAGAGAAERPPAGEAKAPPRTPTERRLIAIWQEVIEVEASGIRDDFFAAGGHSLMATRLLLRVAAAFGVEVPLRDFLDRPTVEALAEQVDLGLLLAADPASLDEILRSLDAESPDLPSNPPLDPPDERSAEPG